MSPNPEVTRAGDRMSTRLPLAHALHKSSAAGIWLSFRTTSTRDGRMSANNGIAGWMQKSSLTICFRTATRTPPD
jgi:hypothetical protein